jgi:pyruvate carboxylase subunit B
VATSLTKPIQITDTTFRDAQQSLTATRMRTRDMEPIATKLDQVGFHSAEVWGGATFDVATRFLLEDPWERLRTLKTLMTRTPLQMLLRGQNLVGYRHYPDDVVEAFVQNAASLGIDIFRIFDALNDERNIQTAARAVKAAGKHAQLCICYSVTEEGHLGGPIYTLDYFLQKALALEEMGADSICIKDMAGLLSPYDAQTLVTALKSQLRIPLQLHTHYLSGMASMTVLKAIESGIDAVDTCFAPFALRTSQPAIEPLVITLARTPRATNFDLTKLIEIGDYLETLAPYLHPHLVDGKLAVVDTKVLTHQVPGGMVSNLTAQLKELGALERLPEVLKDLPQTRRELGYPPLVTPTSQIIGAQAVNNVLFGRWKSVSTQIKDYVSGSYGRPPTPIDPNIVKLVLGEQDLGSKNADTRPADSLEPEMPLAQEATKGLAKDIGDVLIYALYPVTGQKFLRIKYGLEEPLPSTEPQNQSSSIQTPTAPGGHVYNIALAGASYHVTVVPTTGSVPAEAANLDRSGSAPSIPVPPIASPTTPLTPSVAAKSPVRAGEVAVKAPMAGVVLRYSVAEKQKVKNGDTVVILEAMKMENNIGAPTDGVVNRLCVSPGAKVRPGDELVIINKE